MKIGDIVRFIEFPGNKDEPSSTFYLHGSVGILIKKRLIEWGSDWGASWDVLVSNKIYELCYERWMEVLNENR